MDAHGDITIAHAQESVPMSSSSHDTLDMLRERQDLSSLVGVEEVRSGRADAFVSIGHTGATVGASAFGLGRVRGMGRPGLAVELPASHGPVILLDCGAAPHNRGRSRPSQPWARPTHESSASNRRVSVC